MATTRAAEYAAGKGMAAYRATSLFQPHHAREALRDAHEGKIPPLVGLYLALSSVPTARFIAPLGFDAVWIDWEHSSCGVETMTTMVHEIQFMSEGRTIPWVRVPGHDHAAIGYALDAGASVVIPQVNTVAEARHVVSAAKYGRKNHGTRSAPPFRLISGISTLPSDPAETIHENLNRQAAVMIQIETVEAIDNLDAILTECPEIDCVWPGLLDLRVSMDLVSPPNPGALEPEFIHAMAKFESILKKHDKPRSGLAMGPPASQKKQAQNNSLSFLGVDALALRGLADIIPVARQMFPAERKMQDVKLEAPPPQVNGNGNGVAKDAKQEAAPIVNGHTDLKAVKQEAAPLVNGHTDLKAVKQEAAPLVNGHTDLKAAA